MEITTREGGFLLLYCCSDAAFQISADLFNSLEFDKFSKFECKCISRFYCKQAIFAVLRRGYGISVVFKYRLKINNLYPYQSKSTPSGAFENNQIDMIVKNQINGFRVL